MGEVKAITPGFGALPEVVYFDNPKLPGRPRRFDTDAPIAAVRRGESGFYPVYSHSTAEDLNEAEEMLRTVHNAIQNTSAGIAITDRATLAGIVRAHAAAKDLGMPLVIGALLEPVDAAAIARLG